jgi:glucose/mannose transport system permease protein
MTPQRRGRRLGRLAVHAALLPMVATVLFVYLGTILWSVRVSFSSSRTLPRFDWVGFAQYRRLLDTERWQQSVDNMLLFGVLFISACMVLGFLLAVFIDQHVRAEGLLRTVFLYPYAMSFVATGLIWQWMLNPELGIQHVVRGLGFEDFRFDWIVRQDAVMYAIVLAAVWQASGLVMALLLAGLRGIDDSLWKASRIDGIPPWRVYLSVVIPMLGGSIATALVLLSVAVVKVFDVVVAMTLGGPGLASEVPAKFIIDNLFGRANIGLASAASTVMLATVLAFLAPWLYARRRPSHGGGAYAA